MMHITYELGKSEKHGIGLFAGEDIKAGQIVYTASPLLDINITQEQFDTLSEKEKEEVRWWGFFDNAAGCWHVDFDVSKFINHSQESTVTQDGNYEDAHLVATREIKKGEELTQNYLEFESKEDLLRRGIKE